MKYGNCLVAAIIAKIKDPKNVKILKISKKLSTFGNSFHYVWLNTKTNEIHHFVKSKKNHNLLWFCGIEKIVSKDVFDRYILDKIQRYTRNINNKLLNYYNVEDTSAKFGWHYPAFDDEFPSFEDGLPYTERYPYVEIIYGEKPNYKMELIKIEKGKEIELPKDIISWRYQSIYNDTFNALWNVPGKKCEYTKVNVDFSEVK